MKNYVLAGVFCACAVTSFAQLRITVDGTTTYYGGSIASDTLGTAFHAVITLDKAPYQSFPIIQYYNANVDYSFDGFSFTGQTETIGIAQNFLGAHGFIANGSVIIQALGSNPDINLGTGLRSPLSSADLDLFAEISWDSPQAYVTAKIDSVVTEDLSNPSNPPVGQSAVPEPATYALWGVASLLGLACRRRQIRL